MKMRSFRFLRVALLMFLVADVIPVKGCTYSGPKHTATPREIPRQAA